MFFLKFDDIFIEYPSNASDNLKEDSIVITGCTFKRTKAEKSDSTLIYFSNYETKFKFSFTNNRVNINTDGGESVYLFGCNTNDKFPGTVSDNFITSSNKDNILTDDFKGNQDANLDFDFDKDFQLAPKVPDDQITADTSCSSFNFDDLNPSVINKRCITDGTKDDTTFVTVI